MPKYIFLDTWVLSDYTKAKYVERLENFIKHNDYTIAFNGISMAESYNPGWQGGGIEEQGERIANFLGNQHCVIVRPEKVHRFEGSQFPDQVDALPIEMDLDTIHFSFRAQAILAILRREPFLVEEGIDIEQWCKEYETLKKQWLEDAQKITENGVSQGYLIKTRNNRYKADNKEKQELLLCSLDWRLTYRPTDDYQGQDTSIMHSIRFTNLCFWHRYISPPPNQTPKKAGSDIGDLFQLSLLPYCSAFTVDTKMAPTVKLALEEVPYPCQILTHNELKAELQIM